MTITTLPTHPDWCDGSHALNDNHRSVLWAAHNFDMKRVRISLIAFGDAGDNAAPEIGLELVDSEDVKLELWLSPDMAATLVAQLANASSRAAQVTR